MGEATTKTRKKEQFSDMMTTDLTSAEIRYTFGGKFTSQGSWCHPHSINETWEFIYMIRGTAHMYERDTAFSADPGTGILLPPGSQHGGTQPRKDPRQHHFSHKFRIAAILSDILFTALHGSVLQEAPAIGHKRAG